LRALQPLLAVEFLVANDGWVAGPVKAVSRRRRGPQGRLYRIEAALEAENRHECATLLHYYGFRYKSLEALYAARSALQQNLGIWRKETQTEKWCQTKNALGGVSVRLSQFDIPENAMSHLADAKGHYEDVRALCSEESLPKIFATAGVDLAHLCSDRRLAKSGEEYARNLQFALKLQLSALRFFSKSSDPTLWGILQHNLGCSYIHFSNERTDESKSAGDIERAIRHLELSFQVRDPENSLQFWKRALKRDDPKAALCAQSHNFRRRMSGYLPSLLRLKLNRFGLPPARAGSSHDGHWFKARTQTTHQVCRPGIRACLQQSEGLPSHRSYSVQLGFVLSQGTFQ
jgi:tetratricopeptide (TPR) repeat protein